MRRLKSMFNKVKSLTFRIGKRRANVPKGRQSFKSLYAVASCKDNDRDDNNSNNNSNNNNILIFVVVVVVIVVSIIV